MADTGDLKSPALTGVRVRAPPSALPYAATLCGIFVCNEKAPEGAVGYYFGYYSHFFKALTKATVARLLPDS